MVIRWGDSVDRVLQFQCREEADRHRRFRGHHIHACECPGPVGRSPILGVLQLGICGGLCFRTLRLEDALTSDGLQTENWNAVAMFANDVRMLIFVLRSC
jgi:hypothetical protein